MALVFWSIVSDIKSFGAANFPLGEGDSFYIVKHFLVSFPPLFLCDTRAQGSDLFLKEQTPNGHAKASFSFEVYVFDMENMFRDLCLWFVLHIKKNNIYPIKLTF